jgi:hypothetical protein
MNTSELIPTTSGSPMLATSIQSVPLAEKYRAILEQHGCTCEDIEKYTLIVLPQGSVKQELYPRLPVTERYLITLPDGATFFESYDRFRKLSAFLSMPELRKT